MSDRDRHGLRGKFQRRNEEDKGEGKLQKRFDFDFDFNVGQSYLRKLNPPQTKFRILLALDHAHFTQLFFACLHPFHLAQICSYQHSFTIEFADLVTAPKKKFITDGSP